MTEREVFEKVAEAKRTGRSALEAFAPFERVVAMLGAVCRVYGLPLREVRETFEAAYPSLAVFEALK